MSLEPRPRPAEAMPLILVVDDDRRVLELLEIAMSAHGFRVISAGDGDEAIQRAVAERPDLVVLDVRLPRKSGFEVCEWLRRDPEHPDVPIILVSAAVETDARLQAFRRGADDYLAKPFSPKELIARVKRLLVRSSEARQSRKRAQELELELARAREDSRRAHAETRRELRVRELMAGLGGDLQRVLDADELARRLLAAATTRLGVTTAALLVPERPGGPLVPMAVQGAEFEQVSGAGISPGGPLGVLLAGLGRGVPRRDLERFPELREELAAFVPWGMAILAPLPGPEGLEGVLALGERRDGREPDPGETELLDTLCEIGASALFNARRVRDQADRALELLSERAPASAFLPEAASLVAGAARATRLPGRQRALLVHALSLGVAEGEPGVLRSLGRLAAQDPTGRAQDLLRLLELARDGGSPDSPRSPESRRAALLLAVARSYQTRRERGESPGDALLGACAPELPIDPITRQALAGALRELTLVAPHAA
jgi:DNA-binding response OmpR family regulator